MSHAILSPSSASRWLACTKSARLELQFPDNAGAAASEGTLAHAIGELILRYKTKLIKKPAYLKELEALQADKQYEDAMLGHAEDYATFVLEHFAEAQSHTKDALLFLEQRLNLTDYVPEGFGTGDAVIIADTVMEIIDLKYGKGVPVSALNNKQMMLYALGAIREYDFAYDIQMVRMTIYQPRLDNFSTFEMKANDLKAWAVNELAPLAALAFAGEGEFLPGGHCRFCKARAVCKANADYNMELAVHEFKPGPLLTDEDIADILTRADQFTKWINAVEEHALFEAVNNGKQWPGHKLVEGRSNRTYTDENLVAQTLIKTGIDESHIYNKKLVGITAMEKFLGKADFNTYLAGLIMKPPGKPTLVAESDKRPPYNSNEAAKLEFAGAELED